MSRPSYFGVSVPDLNASNMSERFRKFSQNPVIARLPGSFHSVHAANPDIVRFRGRHLLIYRGQDERGHDEIGVATGDGSAFDPVAWDLPDVPSIRVGDDPNAFDSGHILDPAGIVLDDRLFVYYTAHRSDWRSWNVPSHIGLAVSEDGVAFEKHGSPIIEGMAPEVVALDNRVHLIFQRLASEGVFSFYIVESPDGIHFDQAGVQEILTPSRIAGQFDEHSISTARVWREDDWFLMAYGGCRRFTDYPEAIGLARSRDLRRWERYPGNPVLRRGRPGTWDEGALWFATCFRSEETTYLYYEGVGRTPSARGDRELANLCRHTDYGGYAETAFSQIGLAMAKGRLADW
jgi:predicted GH43/DUF377 family glycosyl hydrolase